MGNGTVVTREPIGGDVDDAALNREIVLRIRAAAVRCWVEKDDYGQRWLCTEWNIIGQND